MQQFLRGKAIRVKYFECLFVALGIPHVPYFHMWSARLYSIFPLYLIKDTFSKKSYRIKSVFDFLCNIFLKYVSFQEEFSQV
jgi:hypothetical protein